MWKWFCELISVLNFALGVFYRHGWFVEQDIEKATYCICFAIMVWVSRDYL